MMFVVVSNSNLGLELSDLVSWDSSPLQVVVVLEGQVSGVELVVWGTVCLLEAGVLLSHLHLLLDLSAEVPV